MKYRIIHNKHSGRYYIEERPWWWPLWERNYDVSFSDIDLARQYVADLKASASKYNYEVVE
jgi:hypothetical protein